MGSIGNFFNGMGAPSSQPGLSQSLPQFLQNSGQTPGSSFELMLNQTEGANGAVEDNASFLAYTYGAHSATVTFGSGSGSSIGDAVNQIFDGMTLTATASNGLEAPSGQNMIQLEKMLEGAGSGCGSGSGVSSNSIVGQAEAMFNKLAAANPGKDVGVGVMGLMNPAFDSGGQAPLSSSMDSFDVAAEVTDPSPGATSGSGTSSGPGLSGEMQMLDYIFASLTLNLQESLGASSGSGSGGVTPSTTG